MFTGIIECLGTVQQIKEQQSNVHIVISSAISSSLKIDQSVAHNGVCLTVTEVVGDRHEIVAIAETLSKSNLGGLREGDMVNLERCMVANGRFDGHIVQGHVDQTARVVIAEETQGSWLYRFQYDPVSENTTVEKGSICVNGVSLTCFESTEDSFSVAIIPYTFEHTNFKWLKVNDDVNLEFDIIGKYVKKLIGRK